MRNAAYGRNLSNIIVFVLSAGLAWRRVLSSTGRWSLPLSLPLPRAQGNPNFTRYLIFYIWYLTLYLPNIIPFIHIILILIRKGANNDSEMPVTRNPELRYRNNSLSLTPVHYPEQALHLPLLHPVRGGDQEWGRGGRSEPAPGQSEGGLWWRGRSSTTRLQKTVRDHSNICFFTLDSSKVFTIWHLAQSHCVFMA